MSSEDRRTAGPPAQREDGLLTGEDNPPAGEESSLAGGAQREDGPSAGKLGRAGRAQEASAGGVVVRGEEAIVIVPKRRAADGTSVLGLPKGHIDPGESAIAAARREVREESGVDAEPVCELGETRYWYKRDGRTIAKVVTFFLFTYLAGDVADHDHEIEQARWIGLQEGAAALTYAGEREMMALALARVRQGACKDR